MFINLLNKKSVFIQNYNNKDATFHDITKKSKIIPFQSLYFMIDYICVDSTVDLYLT